MHENLVIADTSCLIILSKIGELDILKNTYDEIIITSEIAREFEENLPDWIRIIDVKDSGLMTLLKGSLGSGESSALALSCEIENTIVILDDLKARKFAKSLRIKVTGTIGVIVKTKLKGVIPSAKFVLRKILKTDFRINIKMIEEAVRQAGETP
jgi:predicted nucleic acid-binding protein